MVPPASVAFMVVTLLTCFGVPIAGLVALRKAPEAWRSFLCGALAFFVSQVATRLPLLFFVVPLLPAGVQAVVQAVPSLSFSAALFEETGRLVVMVWLMKRFQRFADGVAFGLGHGGFEAALLVGLSTASNLMLALAINVGQWDAIAAGLPPEQAGQVWRVMTETSPDLFLAAGVERLVALTLHVTCSLVVLWGVARGRKAIAWIVAVALHGFSNWGMLAALGAGVGVWPVELGTLAVLGVVLALTVRWVRPRLDAPEASR